ADVFHGKPREVCDVVARDLRRSASLPSDDDPVGGGQRFTGDPDVTRVPAVARCNLEERIDDLVRNAIANLILMSFGIRFTREQVASTRQDDLPRARTARRPRSSSGWCSCSGAARGQGWADVGKRPAWRQLMAVLLPFRVSTGDLLDEIDDATPQ